MKRTTIAASILALAAVAHPAAAQDLAAVAAQPAVIADARTSPDGCAVRVLPDGGFMVFATGAGTYAFGNDESDVANARKAAQLAARANLAKFMKESVSTAGGLEEATKSVKRLSASNGAQSVEIDKEMAQKTMQTIRASADALLQGVATLSEAKVPGTGSGGEVRVVCGVSSKTLEARNRLGAALGEAKPEPPPAAPVAPAPASTQAPVVRSTLPAVDLLAVPDGVAVLLPPEGGFLVLSAATAAYDFDDPDDTIQAKNNAEALAKAELAKFMKEKLATESSLDESAGMVKRMSAKDGGESSTIDKNAARKTLQTIRTSADALLQGVATYADANIPGQGKGGEMRVLVGVSSKTMDALDQLKNAWGMSRPAPRPPPPKRPRRTTGSNALERASRAPTQSGRPLSKAFPWSLERRFRRMSASRAASRLSRKATRPRRLAKARPRAKPFPPRPASSSSTAWSRSGSFPAESLRRPFAPCS